MNVKPQSLAQIIAILESSGNPLAMRYEPEYVPSGASIVVYSQIAQVSTDTARVCLATSWGLYQIMGQNLIGLGVDVSFPAYCMSIYLQHKSFADFLAHNGLAKYAAMPLADFLSDDSAVLDFATIYNGPGNPAAYAAAIKRIGGQS